MSHRKVLTNPNTELRVVSEEIDASLFGSDELKTLVDDLIETMKEEDGVGIAAPQIGVHKRVMIVDDGSGPKPYINPKIVRHSFSKQDSEEGCLSVPGMYGLVKRYKRVTVKAFDPDGNELEIQASGYPATIFQHEIDHLEGILFIDKAYRLIETEKNM